MVGEPSARWRVAEGLRVWPKRRRGQAAFVVEQPTLGRFHRLGESEYRLLSRIDAGGHPDGDREQRALRRLAEQGLVQPADSPDAGVEGDGNDNPTGPRTRGPWFARQIVLLRSRKRLAWMERVLSPCFSRWGALLGVCWILFAAMIAIVEWPEFAANWRVVAPNQWLGVVLCVAVLKVLHEMGHAAACRRFGGHVREAGVLLVFFTPLAFVDVSAAWRFASRWRRAAVAVAGVYVELLVAASAVVIWSFLGEAPVGLWARRIAWLVLIASLLVNLNPLMRFDGYFLLADWLDEDNLHQRSREAAWSFLTTGANPSAPRSARLIVYGLLVLAWRPIAWTAIAWAVAQSFGGWGVALLAAAGWAWFSAGGLDRLATFKPNWRTGKWAAVGLAAFCAAAILSRTMPRQSHGIIEYASTPAVRFGAAGIVQEWRARPGQRVTSGEVIARLANPALLARLEEARIAEQQSVWIARRYQHQGDYSMAEAERRRGRALATARFELESRVAALDVRAPVDGVVLSVNHEIQPGGWVGRGDSLCSIGADGERRARIWLAASQLASLPREGTTCKLRLACGASLSGTLRQPLGDGDRRLSDARMAATAGGPLAVSIDDGQPLLTKPYFEAIVRLDGDAHPRAGQRVTMRW